MTASVDLKDRPQCNSIELNRPSPRFVDGALNGNGQLGVLVRARPDAVCLHFGHTAVWDIRHGTLQPDARHHFQWVFDYIWNSFDGKRQFWTEKDWQDYTGKLYHVGHGSIVTPQGEVPALIHGLPNLDRQRPMYTHARVEFETSSTV